jgi:hypothetical protein
MSLHFAAVTFVTALVLAFVWLRGGVPERWGAGIVAARYAVDPVYHWAWAGATFYVMDPGHAVIDSLMLAALVWLALRSNRVWPVWTAAGALIAVLGHAMMLAGKDGMQPAYWAMTNIPHFVQLFALLLGAIFHHWRMRFIGPYRDWS